MFQQVSHVVLFGLVIVGVFALAFIGKIEAPIALGFVGALMAVPASLPRLATPIPPPADSTTLSTTLSTTPPVKS